MNGNGSADSISATISGNVSGQVAVGKDIRQDQAIGAADGGVTDAEIAELRAMLASLRQQVEIEAGPESRDAAIERVDELEEVLTSGQADEATLHYVKGWFARKLPQLAGLVTGVLVNPIVGKVVAAAGDAAMNNGRRG